MRNFADKFYRYGGFNASEIKSISLTILFLTLIVAFNDKSESFSYSSWSMNFFLWFLIIALCVIIKMFGHKLVGVFYGFRVEYQIWWYGLLIGILITLLTGGSVWLLLPGGIIIYHIAAQRIGWFRYGINMGSLAVISLAGPLALITFATFIKTIQLYTSFIPSESILIDKIFLFCLAFAAFSMLPIPPLDGSRILYHSRMFYVFTAGGMIAYAILAYFKYYSWLVAFIMGIIILFLYYYYYESTIP
jgi:Zn-dependent protease